MPLRLGGKYGVRSINRRVAEARRDTQRRLHSRALLVSDFSAPLTTKSTNDTNDSVGLQTNGGELPTNTLNQFGRRRRNIVQRVVDSKFLPFVSAHLVEWQHVYSLYVSQPFGKVVGLIDVINIVSQSRH